MQVCWYVIELIRTIRKISVPLGKIQIYAVCHMISRHYWFQKISVDLIDAIRLQGPIVREFGGLNWNSSIITPLS